MPSRPPKTAMHKAPARHAPTGRRWVSAAIVTAVLNLLSASALASELATLDVLVQDRARVTGPHLAGALAIAAQLFQSAGVRVRWRQSTTGADRPPQFTIVLTSQFDTGLTATLQASDVGIFLRASQRAYIMYDRVVVLGRKHHANAATMLGWVLAHEVGHLVLGDTHAASGVMSAKLTPAQFLEVPFSAAERASIRANTSLVRMPPPTSLADATRIPAITQSSPVDHPLTWNRRHIR